MSSTDSIFKITEEDIRKANTKMINEGKFKKQYPLLYKIKKYFTKPSRYSFKIVESENEQTKNEPNFYTDFLGYKSKIKTITLTEDEINNAWKRARENKNL